MSSTPPREAARAADARPSAAAGGASASASADRPQPLRGYALLLSFYSGVTAAGLWVAHRRGRLPERLRPEDLALTALATQRLSRLVTKDRVTTVVRAPFTAYQGEGGPAELEETPRGTGLRRAIGEVLVCPFCIAQWIATVMGFGLVFAPRVTRFVAGVVSAVAVADLLQLLYKGSERRALS